MAILDKVKTVVLLMFENRSFDHMLGHLSLENINPSVNGLKKPLSQYTNFYNGDTYSAFKFRNDPNLPFDLPHEHDFVDIQLKSSPVTGKFTMKGFVEAYAHSTNTTPNREAEPMGYFSSSQVPITSFLASKFCTCDRWFCPLPTGTQPNRTMAFSGDSPIYKNALGLKIGDNNIFKWMTDNNVRWRVYHNGLPFFALYPSLWKYMFDGDKFRDYKHLAADVQNESEQTAPQVIIIEPCYQDAPHIGMRPNDNHPPLSIGWGEDFLRNTYQAIASNPKKWKSTMMTVYYDEHGGFYDHEPPAPIKYKTTGSDSKQFVSTGPRIPGIVVSPLVKPGSVCSELLDHTSVLQLLAEKFTPGKDYSASVKDRKSQGVKSLSSALNNDTPWAAPAPPSQQLSVSSVLGTSIAIAPTSILPQAFEQVAKDLIAQKPAEVNIKYPDLILWKTAIDNART